MNKKLTEIMVEQISLWAQRGLIGEKLAAQLNERFSSDHTLGSVFLRWLGFVGLFMLGSSILGLIGMSMGEVAQYLAPFALGLISIVIWFKGIQLASDQRQRYPISGAVLVTAGLIGVFGALVIVCELSEVGDLETTIPSIMLVTSAAAILTAYRYGLRWPLTLGVLLAFHGLGNFHSYAGHGGYYMGIQDERLTVIVAAVVIALGMWHEKRIERTLMHPTVGFGQIYIITGLLYANLCLWLLTIPGGASIPVFVFTGATIAQIVMGAKFYDGRWTGFGIVFLAINIYTRLFENFWDEMSKGVFFLLSGMIAIGVGAALEYRARRLKAGSEA